MADYWIKPEPKGFRVLRREKRGKGNPSATYDHKTIDAINGQLASGAITEMAARKMLKEFLDRVKKIEAGRVFHSDNATLLDRYWDDEYETRDNRDQSAAYRRLRRGVNAAGEYSIHAATQSELQKAIKSAPNQPEAAAVLNQLLRFLGRGFKLRRNRQARVEVAYLSWSDFQKALAFVNDPRLQLLYRVMFTSGMRVGEAFGNVRIKDPQLGVIHIPDQMLSTYSYGPTKTGASRDTQLIPGGADYMKEWLAIPAAEKIELRNMAHAKFMRRACFRADVAEIVAKDIRHSYAVHWVSVLGAPVSLVAHSLGNAESVCNRYYAGFTLTAPGLAYLQALIAAKTG